MAFLCGLELVITKMLIGVFAKIGVSGKVAAALCAGSAVVITGLALKKAIEWANEEYDVELSEAHLAVGLKAIQVVMASKDAEEVLDSIEDEVRIQAAAHTMAQYASSFFEGKIDSFYGEAAIAALIHAVGDEKKLGLAV